MRRFFHTPRSTPIVYCSSTKRDIQMLSCIDRYVNANAVPDKSSSCYRCIQGQKARINFAAS